MAGLNFLPASVASSSRCMLQVVEELEEHDPGEQRQPVEIAIEPLVLAHDVARGLEQTAEGLGGGGVFQDRNGYVSAEPSILRSLPTVAGLVSFLIP